MQMGSQLGPRWWPAFGASVLAHVVLIVCAIAWVAIYSHAINPGQPMSVYHAHAQQSGPVISLLVGIPLFFWLARWIGLPQPNRAVATGIMLAIVYFITDIAILIAIDPQSIPWFWVAMSYLTKSIAAFWGGKIAAGKTNGSPNNG